MRPPAVCADESCAGRPGPRPDELGPARWYPEADDVLFAPLAGVLRLLTTVVRGERSADATSASAVADGRLLAAARRVAGAV